ncbi:hypothetical protein BDV09DRAFT_200455 [Aspergillus tetrazonus]
MAQHGGSQPVQTQVELSGTALLAKNTISSVIQVCMEDDVQMWTTIQMEKVGNTLWVSRARIEETQRIFSISLKKPSFWPSRRLIMKKMGLIAGVSMHGWPETISKSLGLTKTFLLVTACRACYTDDEVANTLLEMMWLTDKTSQMRPLLEYNLRFVNAISGYCQGLNPFDQYSSVVSLIRSRVSSPRDMSILFEQCSPKSLATVFVELFTAMQDDDITRITLEGTRSGCFLVAALQWLLEGELQCFFGDSLLFGETGARVVIRLVERIDHAGRPYWHIGRWKEENELKPLIEVRDRSSALLHGSKPTSHTASDTAMVQLSAQCGFRDWQLQEATGILAGAIIMLAYEHGRLYSEKTGFSVALKDICTSRFISSHRAIMHISTAPGGICPSEMDNTVESVRSSIYQQEATAKEKLCHDLHECNVSYYNETYRPMVLDRVDDCEKILEPAIYLAGDALLTCFETENPARRFRPMDDAGVRNHAELLVQMVFQPELFSTHKARGYLFSDFWLAALTRSIPGYTIANQRDLAIANCGYVAYAKVLENISTSARDACIIAVVPGTLRRYDELGRVQERASRLTEVTANDMLRSREFIINDMSVRCFDQSGHYLGIQPREDPTGASLRHLVDRNIDAPVFRITTELRLSYSPPPRSGIAIVQTGHSQKEDDEEEGGARYAPVSWADSIEAIASAQHLSPATLPLSPSVERDLANDWKRRGLYDYMGWHQVGRFASAERNSIAMTASDDGLRFFEAGYLAREGRLFIRHGDCSVVSCLDEAIRYASDLSSNAKWAVLL